jgi:hypothetical protein
VVDLELRQLRSFTVVATELNITRSASRVHLAQQAVSAHVRHLEQALGVTLLVRTSRGVELTAAGKELAAAASLILDDLDKAADRVREVAAGRRGRLRLVSSSVKSASGFFSTAPGVCTTMSSRPWRVTTPSNSALTAADTRASERIASAVTPCLCRAASVSCALPSPLA